MPGARKLSSAALAVVAHIAVASGAAQRPETRAIIGLQATGYLPGHPLGGGTFGIGIGAERFQTRRWSARATLSAEKMVKTRDDISVCSPLPEGGCRPDPVFPVKLLLVEIQGSLTPLMDLAVLHLIGGLGVVFARGSSESHRQALVTHYTANAVPFITYGAELSLGRGTAAPRLQLARHVQSRPMLAATSLMSVRLLFSLGP